MSEILLTPDQLQQKFIDGEIKGHYRDDKFAAQYAAESARPLFMMAAPDVMDMPKRDCFPYRYFLAAHKKKYGFDAKSKYQQDGTCVGQSFARSKTIMAALYSEVFGYPFIGEFSVAGDYTFARVDVGGQPGQWQGAPMVYAAKASTTKGSLLMSDLGLDTATDAKAAMKLQRQDELLALKWTNTREGVPATYEPAAYKHLVAAAPQVTTWEEAGKAVQVCNLILHGSNLIPDPVPDQFGFCRKLIQIRGGHAVKFCAVRWDPFGLLYWNTWDDQWTEGHRFPDDQPAGSIWLNSDQVQAILSQRDSYVLTHEGGLVPDKRLVI